ncbi:NUDIX domain-containing protein [Actinoplanes sp. NPDC051851]|uniref:NUDIX hydrolase n=1 Tax=Actinoplanes sp. NPDC051851 TaxID=3154753 RepID=UPI00342DA2FD
MTGPEICHLTASAIVFDHDGRVLLVEHRLAGRWLYPGGHLDDNEDPAAAALRETREETGIAARILGDPSFTHPTVISHPAPFAVIEMPVHDEHVGAHRHIDMVYVCRALPGRQTLIAQLSEVAAARWVALPDVADLTTPPELPDLLAAAAVWAKDR